MTRTRLTPKDRREQLLGAALEEAQIVGYLKVTRQGVADRAGVAPALISSYFGTMPTFRRVIMRAAISQRILPVVAQGLAARDRFALDAPDELKSAALAALAN